MRGQRREGTGALRGAAGMALPRSLWNFSALCWLLAMRIPASLALECGEHQYFLHGKCCNDCAPGQRMRSRCTPSADTACLPCQDGYFSSRHHHGFCQSCTVCQSRKGSVEVKPCEKTSDRGCECRAGFAPTGIPEGSECSQCPAGTFSRGRNQKCQPWTNCSFFGKITLRPGTATEDSLCSRQDPIPTEFLENRDPIPTEFPENSRDPTPTEFPENSRVSREIPDLGLEPNGAEPGWGFLSLLLLCLILLVVSGISILLLIFQTGKKSRNGPGRSIQHSGRSCRIPIQEEQADSNSSLTKN